MHAKASAYIERAKSSKLDIIFYFILTISLLIRVVNLNYNSAFNDEGIYVVLGKMGLFAGDWWSYGANLWMAGLPYIYPPLTALAYQIGGLIGSRLLNVFFGVLLIEEVYRFTRLLALYDERTNHVAALIASFFAAFAGIGLYVSELATYDILSFFLLLFAMNSFLKAANFENGKYYLLCSVGLLFAFFTKIIIAVFYPVLFLAAFIILKNRPKPHFRLALIYLFIPLFIGISLYIITNLGNLLTYVATHKDLGKAESLSNIFEDIAHVTGFTAICSLPAIPIFIKTNKSAKLLWLITLSLVIPLFHLALNREQTLNKHLYLTLIFLAVIAAYGAAVLIFSKIKLVRIMSLATLTIAGIFFIFSSQNLAHELQSEWRNTNDLQAFLKESVHEGDKILTENGGAVILSLYNITFPPKNIVTFDWIDYSNLTGDEGYLQAVEDRYFDFIEIDNQFAGRDVLRASILTEMGSNYRLIYDKDDFQVYERVNT
jgi:hypothetical protein